ncbi:MAG: tetratricopeptide repeat protein [Acholeplasmataceae bacterium]|nr:tetratricopeptide repeat protein [Acholeplasmataceae bacterium]
MKDFKDQDHKIITCLEEIDQLIDLNDEANLPKILSLYDEALALEVTLDDLFAHNHYVAFIDDTYLPYLRKHDRNNQDEIIRILQKTADIEIGIERYDDSERHQRLVLDELEKRGTDTPESKAFMAKAMHRMAFLYSVTFRYGRAEVAFERALDLFRQIKDEAGSDPVEDIAKIRLDMARMYERDKKKEEALQNAEKALALYIEANTNDNVLLSDLYEMTAIAYHENRQLEDAVTSYEHLLEIDQKRLDEGDQKVDLRLARTYFGLATVQLKLKNHEASHQAIDKAIACYSAFDDDTGALYQGLIGKSWVQKATIDQDQNNQTSAILSYEKGLAAFVTLPEESKKVFVSDLANLHHDLGVAYFQDNQQDKALEHLIEADRRISNLIRIQTEAYVTRYAKNSALLARLYDAFGQTEKASEEGKRAVAIYHDLIFKDYGTHSKDYVDAVNRQVLRHKERSAPKAALKVIDQAIKALEKCQKMTQENTAEIMTKLLQTKVDLLTFMGKAKKALRIKEKHTIE